jgi:hypothetical protein
VGRAARALQLAPVKLTHHRLLKDRLGRFARGHRAYVNAQRTVEAAELRPRAVQARLAESDAIRDEAVLGRS